MKKNPNHFKFQLCALLTFLAFVAAPASAQYDSILDQRIRKIMERPEFAQHFVDARLDRLAALRSQHPLKEGTSDADHQLVVVGAPAHR